MGDQPVGRPLHAHRTAQIQNKLTQTSMPQVEFEPTITAFERAKIFHVSDRAATVIGIRNKLLRINVDPTQQRQRRKFRILHKTNPTDNCCKVINHIKKVMMA
jgi:hypothetical protein